MVFPFTSVSAPSTGKSDTKKALPWTELHSRIKPISKEIVKSNPHESRSNLVSQKFTARDVDRLESVAYASSDNKVAANIDKNETLSRYENSCLQNGIQGVVTTVTKGKNTEKRSYPSHYTLISECKMKPNKNLYYRVEDLRLDNVIIFLVKDPKSYLSESDLVSIRSLNVMYDVMMVDVVRLRDVDFWDLKQPRLNYAQQVEISNERINKATACAIYYGLNPSMVIRFIKGEYVGESRDSSAILSAVSQHINEDDCRHIERIINQGCPSFLNFEERYENKHAVLRRGNQTTFLEHPEVTAKAVNKEEKNSHILPFKGWLVYFSPYCRATPQGIREKNGKFRVIFDASTRLTPDEIVLNDVTNRDDEAEIDFGKAKLNLLINIYNWRISYPNEKIYLALADITACFRFPRISADVAGAFGFVAEGKYFVSTSMVFGSNISANAWDALRRGIQNTIPTLSQRTDLVEVHEELISQLRWAEENSSHTEPATEGSIRTPTTCFVGKKNEGEKSPSNFSDSSSIIHHADTESPSKFNDSLRIIHHADTELVQAFPCTINRGVLDETGILLPMKANVYVDDILMAAVFRANILRLLAATIEGIFLVCGRPDISLRQCPLSLEKWHELVVGPTQIVLGLSLDTNKMTVGITEDYIQQVRSLLQKWDPSRRFFNVSDMQKLVGKLARLGEGAPWIYKLMSHLYTSLAFALKSNTELLNRSSLGFRELVNQIKTKNFSGNQSDHQRHIKFAMKEASRMINKHKHKYLVNETMREELNFISDALTPDSGINFETPIAHLIPRTPTALIIGDSSLIACGGYSITLEFWWHLAFPTNVIHKTLLHLENGKDETFISINCLEFVTIIINYCATIVKFANCKINDDPYPVVLCVTDNTSALNWTLHTSKKSIIGRALARFFCGLLIGSRIGINAKWISTIENIIADKISRLKENINSDSSSVSHSSSSTYDYSKLKQEHEELEVCSFFQPSPKLLSLIWEILLTQRCPDLSLILRLKPQDLGKLCI